MRSRFTASLNATLGGLFVILGVTIASPAGAAVAPSALLTGQTTTVSPTFSGQSPFTVSIAVQGVSGPTSISAQLFSRITTRSGLLSALSPNGPSGVIDQIDPVSTSCLPASTHGGVALSIDVITSTAHAPTLAGGCIGSTHPPTFDLRCQLGSGSCNGVYPVAIAVTSGSATVSKFVTLMTFVERPAAVPLRVSTLIRLNGADTGSAPSTAAVAHVLAKSPTVPVDLALGPAVIQKLLLTSAGHGAVSELAQVVAQNAPTHEILRTPYVSVDPGVLASSGLSGEVTRQIHRGQQILTAAGFTSSNPTTWLATAPVTASTTPALAAAGFTRLIAPDTSLAQPTATSLQWGQPFHVTPGDPSVDVMPTDGILAAQAAGPDLGVLGAERLLGDLAFLHFERPGLTVPQGVVVETSSPLTDASTFLTALLNGLSGNPVLSPITIDGMFSQVPSGANGAPATRTLADTGASPAWPAPQLSAFKSESQRQTAFASAVQAGNPIFEVLSDDLLAVELDDLGQAGRTSALHRARNRLDQQLSMLAIGGGDITLTALRSSLPITITSTTGYKVTGILILTSSHLTFPKGSTYPEVLDRSTKSLRIVTQAVTTGDLPLHATLVTPSGGLVLAHQRIVVHATHTSVVAIILTIGSAVVLLVWWIRTWWRKPRRRRATP